MKVIAPWGKAIIVRDPPEDRTASGRIVLPSTRVKQACTGTVLLHSPIAVEDCTLKRVIFDKWAGKKWKVDNATFETIPERAILAVLEDEGEKSMTRDELIEAITDEVKAQVDDNRELSEEDLTNLGTIDVADVIESVEEEESEEARKSGGVDDKGGPIDPNA